MLLLTQTKHYTIVKQYGIWVLHLKRRRITLKSGLKVLLQTATHTHTHTTIATTNFPGANTHI